MFTYFPKETKGSTTDTQDESNDIFWQFMSERLNLIEQPEDEVEKENADNKPSIPTSSR